MANNRISGDWDVSEQPTEDIQGEHGDRWKSFERHSQSLITTKVTLPDWLEKAQRESSTS